MIEIGKYYKSKYSPLVVKATSGHAIGEMFAGIVIVPDEKWEKGRETNDWFPLAFEPCEAPQGTETTKPDPSPVNDTELRLKCLELAVKVNQSINLDMAGLVKEANKAHNWVTQTEVKNID